jgi:cytochrome c556
MSRFESRHSVFIVAVAALSLPAFAATPTTPVEWQKARHEHYEDLGAAFKTVRDNVRAPTPDFVAVEKAAVEIQQASVNQGQWFPKGSGPEAGKTRALAEIWTKGAEFTAAQKLFEEKAPKLLAASKTKDAAQIQAAFRDLGGACKNCHDNFRSPEE